MRVSYSMLNTYMTCPLQARFKYIDKLSQEGINAKAVFGKAIHAALDHYNRSHNIDAAVAVFKDNWANPEKMGDTPGEIRWPKFTTFGGLMEKGIETLRRYDDLLKWEGRRVLATEHRFLVPFGEHELYGFVDLLEVKKSGRGQTTLRIVDYKTNGKAPNRGELFLNIQFTAYVYASLQREFWTGYGDVPGLPDGEALYEEFIDTPRRAIWYGLLQYKEYDAGQRDEQDFKRLYRAVNEIAKAIEHNVFVPNISGEACSLCDFTEPCGISIPTAVEIREKEESWF